MTTLSPRMSVAPQAVVIVPTRNHADSLDRCLRALCADSSYVAREIVVVDNGSTDNTADVVASVASDAPLPVRRVSEPRAGACRARNVGIAESAAPFVLFADDDVTAHDGWADALVGALSAAGVVAAGGRVLPVWSGTAPKWLIEGPAQGNAALEDYGTVSFGCGPERLPFGANLGFRRTALVSFRQPFDERLGHRGRVAMGHEEWHLLKQLLRTGEVRYEAAAVVDHHVSASRMNYKTIQRRMWQLGFGAARSARLLGEPQPSWRRVAVRTVRVGREARRLHRKATAGTEISADDACEDFRAHFWWGLHAEMLTGRFPWLADLLADRVLGRG